MGKCELNTSQGQGVIHPTLQLVVDNDPLNRQNFQNVMMMLRDGVGYDLVNLSKFIAGSDADKADSSLFCLFKEKQS